MKRIERFRESIGLFGFHSAKVAEWDFSDRELLQISGIRRCPKCGAPLDCDDGVIHCTECDWVLS